MFSTNKTSHSPWQRRIPSAWMMTHATLELNENPKNKAKYVHGSLKLNIIFIDSVESFLVLPPIMPPQQD